MYPVVIKDFINGKGNTTNRGCPSMKDVASIFPDRLLSESERKIAQSVAHANAISGILAKIVNSRTGLVS